MTTVAASHDDKLLDRARLHGLDHLVGKREDLLMRKTADDLALLQFLRRRTLLRQLDDSGEVLLAVLLLDMRTSREADGSRREDAILIARLRRHDAVRRHEDRTVERLELFLLLPPSIAVVARKVCVLLEGRIVVRGQHFAVRVDIDARTLCLIKQFLQILEIVTRDQDARVLAHAEINLSDFRIAVSLRVRLVQESHDIDAVLARLQHESREIVTRKAVIQEHRQRLLHEGIDRLVAVVDDIRMMIVRRHALEAVRRKLPKAANILVFRRENADVCRSRLRLEFTPSTIPKSCCRQLRRICYILQQLRLHAQRLFDRIGNRCIVEVRIRNRDEEIQRNAIIDCLSNRLSRLAQSCRNSRNPLRHINQEILKSRDLRLLTANAHLRAALAACRLLTLKAKHLVLHIYRPLFFRCNGNHNAVPLDSLIIAKRRCPFGNTCYQNEKSPSFSSVRIFLPMLLYLFDLKYFPLWIGRATSLIRKSCHRKVFLKKKISPSFFRRSLLY